MMDTERRLRAPGMAGQPVEAQAIEAQAVEAQAVEDQAQAVGAQAVEDQAQAVGAQTVETQTVEAQTVEAQTVEAQAQAVGAHAVQVQAVQSRAIIGAPDPLIADPLILDIGTLAASLLQSGPDERLARRLRQRLVLLRPSGKLCFAGLLFHPLNLLIVPASRWRPGQHAIPITALRPMAEHVRLGMGGSAAAIETEIAGRTTEDLELIVRLGQVLWSEAAGILADTSIPETWDETELGTARYRPLASTIAVLLAEAAAVETLHAEAATFLLRPAPKRIAAILDRVARTNMAALPMMIAVLLDRLPHAVALPEAALLATTRTGAEADGIRAALDDAVETLLHRFDQEDHLETRIGAASLESAGTAADRIASLLQHLETRKPDRRRREQLVAARRRLDVNCRTRFTRGLLDELLAPLDRGCRASPDIPTLEAAARGLRILETACRVVGSGSGYDRLLGQTAAAIRDATMRDRLSPVDQRRLVEILVGSDAALAMLDRPL
jgi:hypothetical protein